MKNLLLLLVLTSSSLVQAQVKKPKLIIGIVVDQMRYEYLYRFQAGYGNDGFKKLLKEGYSFENAHYNYIPTYTGPGHSSIFTGTTPASHGIVSNYWYDPNTNESKYCVSDSTVTTIGESSSAGKMSPFNQKTTTIGDELIISSNGKSKVIGVAIKDRSAILPVGHAGNAAYWLSSKGNFISSSYYLDKLPDWVKQFNVKKLPVHYLRKDWETFYPIEKYTSSFSDNNHYEGLFAGEKQPTFPHKLWRISEKGTITDVIKSTPFGNTLTRNLAEAAILGEQLGKDQFTDLLTISFSSIDYIGHQYGPNSIEMEDAMIRLDQEIAHFLKFLDSNVGQGEYTIFLTADHGVANVPSLLIDHKIPAGYFDSKVIKEMEALAQQKFNAENLIRNFSNYQIFYNHEVRIKHKITVAELDDFFRTELLKLEGSYNVLTRKNLLTENYTTGVNHKAQLGYYPKLSGDLWLIIQPGWIATSATGTTHGSAFSYDTHVPLIWYGQNIPAGISTKKVDITDIAPTAAYFLKCPQTNGNIGKILDFK